ncbi:MAG TPA: prephenate dehydratase [Bryobacteraceae bacterium]|jgi:prephenate dehydratase|nr:prephenate dehydratase [Bryobacteraceae bacterium]
MSKTSGPSVAFQGEFGAFSHIAAEKLLGAKIHAQACPSFNQVFEVLKKGVTRYAVIPIENTLHGSIYENYDHLLDSEASIVGETSVRISHQLITMPSVRYREVRKVFSHPVALNQCRLFFSGHPAIEPVPFYDTAGSVKMLQSEQPEAAGAIASEAAAVIYGGVIRRRNIEDHRQNFTRFFLLAKRPGKRRFGTGLWKTSVAFSMANRAGQLFKALGCFALRDITLTKMESRPLRGKPWEYLFYVDFVGAATDTPVKNALANLAELSEFLKILGSYRPTP